MKKAIFIFLGFVTSLVFASQVVLARTYPQAVGFVNDFAKVLSTQTITTIEEQLVSLEASASHELVVVTLSSLEDDYIESTAVELFQQWGIGKKNQDNGVLLLIAPNDRELRIEVGYGLEPVLTDSRAGSIVRNVITPEFKNDDYDTGVTKGVNAIIKVITKDPSAFDISSTSSVGKTVNTIGLIWFVGTFLTVYAVAFLSRSKKIWPGGVIGGISGYLLGLSSSVILAIIAAILLGFWGLLLDFILSKNYKTRKSKGLPTSWWSSKGGFSSKSSGGFGGFGGGSSGGGGASGSW